MRAARIIGIVAGGLVGLVLLCLVLAWLFIDPNDYKDRIAQAVKSSTGRELSLPGDIRLSLFPWLALELGPASLGNPPGFGDEPFATVQRASARVRLLPLLRGDLQVGRVRIEGLDLRLREDAQGRGNWEGFGEDAVDEPTPQSGSPRFELAGLEVRDSRISYDGLVIEALEVDVGRVAGSAPVPVSLSARLVSPGQPPLPVAFSARELTFDLEAQTLAAPAFEARLGAARVDGRVQGSRVIDAPAFAGEFTLQPVSLRELLPQLGIEVPDTRDARALTHLSAGGRFTYEGETFTASDLTLKLDDSTLTGSVRHESGSGALGFDLVLDRIDADRYLPPPTELAPGAKSEPFELPVELVRALEARGQMTIGEARFSGMPLSKISVSMDIRDGLAKLAPARASLYGGQYAGEVVVDARPPTPRLTLDQTLTGVDVAALMGDLFDSRRLSGRGKVVAKLAAQGRNSDALVRTLSGRVTTDLEDGAVEGLDIWYAIAQAQSLVKQRQLADTRNTGRTAFDTFHASADLVNGVATTRDLQIASQLLRVTGQGSANLVTDALDYQVTATVLKAPPGADEGLAELQLASIPVKITGTFDDPRIRPDLEGLARQRLKQELNKRTDEIKDKVRDRLRGLFGN